MAKRPTKTSRGGAAALPVPVPPTEFVPLTHVTVLGQPRGHLGLREHHGFVLTERGWEKEEEANG